ncbi:MAG: methionine adenosyltransferase [Planctomycetes bacterium]|nr:methionine adenosyltransferase [Planctomycetota bacterium]
MRNTGRRLFTSEAICMGHPDKVADQISDAILDELLRQDPKSRVACETMVKSGLCFIAGEITTHGYVEVPPLVKKVIEEIGYTDPTSSFNSYSVGVLTCIEPQSPDIAQGVNEDKEKSKEMGAGDQGMMFGFACRETPELMPMPVALARKLVNRAAEMRQNGTLPYLRPDGKSQVTVEYENDKPVRIHTVVLSMQHAKETTLEQMRSDFRKHIIDPILPAELVDQDLRVLVNPTGLFVQGGPSADCGLTGRKIIVDTYGGMGHHGGGAFSGKDPSKVDRSACYYARYAAKNIVAAGLADRCEIQVAYAIGVARPVSINLETYGTGRIPNARILELVEKHFDFRPRTIIDQLNLLRPIYKQTARYGHFGIEKPDYTWERTDKAEALRREAGLAAAAAPEPVGAR